MEYLLLPKCILRRGPRTSVGKEEHLLQDLYKREGDTRERGQLRDVEGRGGTRRKGKKGNPTH